MSKIVENIVTLSNVFEAVNEIQTKIGYEFQAPLDEATQNEVVSSVIKERLEELTDND